MKLRHALIAVAIGVVAGASIGLAIGFNERDRAIERANIVADSFTAVVNAKDATIEERGWVVEGQESVIKFLAEHSVTTEQELLKKLEASNAVALTATRTVGLLEDSIRNLLIQGEQVNESLVRFPILWKRDFDEYNFFRIDGSLQAYLDTWEATLDLDMRVGFSMNMVVSREEDMSLRCDAQLGMPDIATLTRLDCIDNLEDPFPEKKSFLGNMFSFDVPSLLGNAVSFGLGLAIGHGVK